MDLSITSLLSNSSAQPLTDCRERSLDQVFDRASQHADRMRAQLIQNHFSQNLLSHFNTFLSHSWRKSLQTNKNRMIQIFM